MDKSGCGPGCAGIVMVSLLLVAALAVFARGF
jgi:hypothetical protein